MNFQINPFYEKLLQMRRTRPRDFESISPVSKLALAEYERQKRRAAELEAMRQEDELPPAA